MKLEIELKDINGSPIEIGDKVCAYAQEYAEVSRDESNGVPVIELDRARPKPIRDVPLFIGRVVWDAEQLAFEIAIEKLMVDWEAQPSSVRMGGGHYVYELVAANSHEHI